MAQSPSAWGSHRQSASGARQQIDANQFVHEIIGHEIQAQKEDNIPWRFLEVSQESGAEKTWEVCDTENGEIKMLVAINGQPLTAAQRQSEIRRMNNLLSHGERMLEDEKQRRSDDERERNLLKEFPEAFLYQYDGQEGDITKLSFFPNPQYHPRNHETQVFHHMAGTMWLDGRQKRLAGIDAHLITEVKFGEGWLGHLDAGGTFSVRQKDLGSGRWELSKLDVQMTGKALFFKTIGAHQRQNFSDYKQLPNSLTLAQAAQLLEGGSRGARNNSESSD